MGLCRIELRRIAGSSSLPSRGAKGFFFLLRIPRLRRGLNDRARFAGFGVAGGHGQWLPDRGLFSRAIPKGQSHVINLNGAGRPRRLVQSKVGSAARRSRNQNCRAEQRSALAERRSALHAAWKFLSKKKNLWYCNAAGRSRKERIPKGQASCP